MFIFYSAGWKRIDWKLISENSGKVKMKKMGRRKRIQQNGKKREKKKRWI